MTRKTTGCRVAPRMAVVRAVVSPASGTIAPGIHIAVSTAGELNATVLCTPLSPAGGPNERGRRNAVSSAGGTSAATLTDMRTALTFSDMETAPKGMLKAPSPISIHTFLIFSRMPAMTGMCPAESPAPVKTMSMFETQFAMGLFELDDEESPTSGTLRAASRLHRRFRCCSESDVVLVKCFREVDAHRAHWDPAEVKYQEVLALFMQDMYNKKFNFNKCHEQRR